MKDFIDIADYSNEVIQSLIESAFNLKKTAHRGDELEGKTIGLIFEKPSLRTRVSFEMAIHHLKGHAITLQQDEIQLGKRESIEDVAQVLSRYVDMVMIRTFEHENIKRFAQSATIPIINGLTNTSHPCQALADALTIYEHFNRLEGIRVTYLGDDNNVSRSLAEICVATGMHCTISSPKKHNDDMTGVNYVLDPKQAIENADVIYTDTWISMGAKRNNTLLKELEPYQLNQSLIKVAPETAIVLHCLPAHRGDEITDTVLTGPQSKVFDQAENRYHAQKALLVYLSQLNSN
tara:strand:+ start:3596 stop:4471 length:876 start_codon:yes stop_codon:yes gene_type:complete